MSTEEIKKKFPPQEVEKQIDFENYMSELNNAQSEANHPYIDELSELHRRTLDIEVRMKQLAIERDELRIRKHELEAERKDINRVCHDLKHEMIRLNPREKFVKAEVA